MLGLRITTDQGIQSLLAAVRTVAVVGLSPDPGRDSHRVAAYLQTAGYRIVPIHPSGGTILGETVYGSLADLPDSVGVDLVDVFRRPDALPALVGSILGTGARAVWLQLGVVNAEAEEDILAGGLDLVADRCLKVEHQRLTGG